jgi:hypothetical protein
MIVLLVQILVVILIVGIIFWAVERLAPMTETFRVLLRVFEVIVALLILLWALKVLGVLPALHF